MTTVRRLSALLVVLLAVSVALAALPKGTPYAVEVRDREVLGPAYAAALAAGGAVHGVSLDPRLPAVAVLVWTKRGG